MRAVRKSMQIHAQISKGEGEDMIKQESRSSRARPQLNHGPNSNFENGGDYDDEEEEEELAERTDCVVGR